MIWRKTTGHLPRVIGNYDRALDWVVRGGISEEVRYKGWTQFTKRIGESFWAEEKECETAVW